MFMDRAELRPFLETLKGKSLLLKNSGYMACQAEIKEFNFEIKYNIIMMKDNKSENYMVLNLEKIKEIYKDDENLSLVIYIDDEIETEISIKLKNSKC